MASPNTKVQSQSQVKSSSSVRGAGHREPRPFLRIRPMHRSESLSTQLVEGFVELEARVGPNIQLVVRSLVNYTVASQNRRLHEAGRTGGTTLSILNRRRRAARAWILVILSGELSDASLRSLTHSWLPQLSGTGPELALAVPAGKEFLEFLKGAITGLVMAEPKENLVPEAKALHALETVLGVHLQALREVEFRAEDPRI